MDKDIRVDEAVSTDIAEPIDVTNSTIGLESDQAPELAEVGVVSSPGKAILSRGLKEQTEPSQPATDLKKSIMAIEKQKQPKKSPTKTIMLVIAAIVLIAASAAGAYFYRGKQADEFEAKQNDNVAKLKSDNNSLLSQLSIEKDKNTTNQMIYMSAAPSETKIENIKAAVTSGNTAALKGYMATNVNVLVAGSDSNAVKTTTPALAITSLDSFISDAKSPWNFPPSKSVIHALNSAGWTQYVPNNAVVGESANKKVVSFSFNYKSEICTVLLIAFKSVNDFN